MKTAVGAESHWDAAEKGIVSICEAHTGEDPRLICDPEHNAGIVIRDEICPGAIDDICRPTEAIQIEGHVGRRVIRIRDSHNLPGPIGGVSCECASRPFARLQPTCRGVRVINWSGAAVIHLVRQESAGAAIIPGGHARAGPRGEARPVRHEPETVLIIKTVSRGSGSRTSFSKFEA